MIIVKKDTDLEEHSKEQQRNKEEKDMKFDICLFCFFYMTVSILFHT